MRYFKGSKAVPREQRFCKHCSKNGVFVIGDEKHVLENCPQFGEERKQLDSSIRNILYQRHYKGFMPRQDVPAIRNRELKQDVQENGDKYRSEADWCSLLQWKWENLWRGFFPGIVMGEEGFEDIAWVLGKYVHIVVQTKENDFQKSEQEFRDTIVH